MAFGRFVPRWAPLAFGVASWLAGGGAGAETRNYRFSLGTPSTVSRYVNPLPASPEGPYMRVETDALGRVVSVEAFRHGASQSRTTYEYAAGGRLPTRSSDSTNGETTGYVTYRYYPGGDTLSSESFTAAGKPTGHVDCTALAGGKKDCDGFAADGKPVSHKTIFYDSQNIAIRQKYWKDGAVTYHLASYDPQDGLETENDLIAFDGDKPVNFSKLSYDANGDRLRRDGYDGETRKPFASIEYEDDEAIRKTYHYLDGTSYVALHHYNDKRTWTSSDISINGAALFRFVYVRQPDGTVVKTQAQGLNGDLWAEYPNLAIDEVDRNGRYTSNAQLGVIYKAGPWW